ncbi:MAG: hypothetical protein Q7R66_09805 [Undibacterium sp.]|uniref:hypothetical protein n=1 Tax=Undibacterium sp. TaxID=1914977 RepID=UPI0027215EDE|nr:hypothetical protein [Undibacterium sp.]MDO8652472.1 hypothetical protein [Undibacterium sp.]
MTGKKENMWLTWDSIKQAIKGRRTYLYGRSEDWVHKAVTRLPNDLLGIIDRERAYHGQTYKGLDIMPLESIESINECYFIITAGDFDGIVEGLIKLNLKPGEDFSCSPDFRDYKVLEKIRSYEANILFSSSDYNDATRARGSRVGGGMFILQTPSGKIDRVATGSYRQFERSENFIYAVEYVEKALVKFDLNFNVVSKIQLDKPNFCGLAIDPAGRFLYLANAGSDEIYTFNLDTLTEIARRKFHTNGLGSEHHVNDLCFDNEILYCSYFSYCGGFKRGIFDGGVSAIDVNNPESLPTQLIGGLWKPHTPKLIDGRLVVLDSMRGRLLSGSPKSIGKFPGFVRGMFKSEQYWIIAQSEDMYLTDRMSMTEDAVVLNSGVYIFDEESMGTYFYPTPGIMNIHCLASF